MGERFDGSKEANHVWTRSGPFDDEPMVVGDRLAHHLCFGDGTCFLPVASLAPRQGGGGPTNDRSR
jgi:hypothetical protein